MNINTLHLDTSDKTTKSCPVEDVASLSKLLDHCKCETTLLESHSFSIQSCKLMHDYCVVKASNLATPNDIISCNGLSKTMGDKIAASGLGLTHLRHAYRRNGQQALLDVLGEEMANGKVRVTKSQKVIEKIARYLEAHL